MVNRLIKLSQFNNSSCPVIMGILNVTPDSFSDGGEFLTTNAAVLRALKMAEEGADIIDIGGESTRPGSEPVSADEELARILPVIRAIRQKSNIQISIDTTKASVAEEAIRAGANIINDVSAGLSDKRMFGVAAKCDVPIILMHMRGSPKTMQAGEIHYHDVVGEVAEYLKDRASSALLEGVASPNIMIDPGIGFGKTVENNMTILKELPRLKKLNYPVVIGVSRKSFLGKVLGIADPKNRLEGSLAAAAIAVKNGADIVRVHDVAATRRFFDVFFPLL